jgi:hypothetical protein
MRMRHLSLAFVFALLGCADDEPRYAGLEFDVVSAPPTPVSLQTSSIELVEGVAVRVDVTIVSRGERFRDRDLLTLRPREAERFAVYRGEESDRSFVIVGLRAGDSCLEVTINRELEECIPVRIR